MKARSILLAAAGALAVTGLAAPAFAQPYDWHHDRDHWRGHDRYYPPPPRPYYPPPPRAYYAPPPVVYTPPPAYYAPPPPVVYASPGVTFGITIP